MKKRILSSLLAAGLLLSINVYAQKNIPDAAKKSIAAAYPTVKNVKWEKEGNNYEAGFKQNDKSMSVVLTASGNILETETSIKTTDLPSAAIAYLKSKFGAAVKITEAASIKKANGTTVFEAEVKGSDYLFDTKGKFMKSEKE